MREKLANVEGVRTEWSGTFKRFGTKPAYKGNPLPTVLLVEIKDGAGVDVCDHLWFNLTKEFEALNLQPGDRVKFCARVRGYWKGYGGEENQTRDLKLSHPTKITRITAAPVALEMKTDGAGQIMFL